MGKMFYKIMDCLWKGHRTVTLMYLLEVGGCVPESWVCGLECEFVAGECSALGAGLLV